MMHHGDFKWENTPPTPDTEWYASTQPRPCIIPCPYCTSSTHLTERITTTRTYILLHCQTCGSHGIAAAPTPRERES